MDWCQAPSYRLTDTDEEEFVARSGDALQHPVTGEKVVWLKVAGDTKGERLQGDLFVPPGGFFAAEHVHPNQEERFEVLAGMLSSGSTAKNTPCRRVSLPSCPPGGPMCGGTSGRGRHTS